MPLFQKGQSGNPGGRKKHPPDVKEMARLHTKEAIARLVFWLRSDDSKASVTAAVALLDRGYGKPALAITGPEGQAILPTVVIHQVLRDSETPTVIDVSGKRLEPHSAPEISALPPDREIPAPEPENPEISAPEPVDTPRAEDCREALVGDLEEPGELEGAADEES